MRRTRKYNYSDTEEISSKKLFYLLVIILGLCIFIITFVASDYSIVQVIKLNKMKKELYSEINQLKMQQDSLKAERLRLERDLEYIEKIARERYRMVKKGERVFKVIEK
ncbi:MAG: septum formation initiator family protein [Candidatus Marinimicrobia bacterium]|nr:septum formation initiator family protein [Candidatus Neomarinimicrobiota bacterium]